MTTPEFVIQTMREMDARFFTIHDTNYRLVYHQWQNISLDESVKRFQNFVDNAAINSFFNVARSSSEMSRCSVASLLRNCRIGDL